jgi:Flp pilus assembly protein TadD
VQRDDALAEAHTLLGLIRTFYEHDWPLAENDFWRAIEMAPGSVLPYKQHGLALGMLRRFDEAFAQLSRALASEPRSSEMHVGLGIVLQT